MTGIGDALITEYQFRPIGPDTIIDWSHWIVYVRPFDLTANDWGVKSLFQWLSPDGEWVYVPYDDTVAGHFTLDKALALAAEAQWTLQVNRLTARDILAKLGKQ